jgi:hypothetical protein
VFGELTPERMAHNAPKQNYGIARRSMPHLTWLVRKAARALDAMESRAKAAERNETRKTGASSCRTPRTLFPSRGFNV